MTTYATPTKIGSSGTSSGTTSSGGPLASAFGQTPTAGNMLICTVFLENSSGITADSITTPSGWTLAGSVNNSTTLSGSQAFAVYYKVATSSETAPSFTIGGGGANGWTIFIEEWFGLASFSAMGAVTGGGNMSAGSFPTVTFSGTPPWFVFGTIMAGDTSAVGTVATVAGGLTASSTWTAATSKTHLATTATAVLSSGSLTGTWATSPSASQQQATAQTYTFIIAQSASSTTASLTLSGSGAAKAAATMSGSLGLGGALTVPLSASGSLSLSGSGSGGSNASPMVATLSLLGPGAAVATANGSMGLSFAAAGSAKGVATAQATTLIAAVGSASGNDSGGGAMSLTGTGTASTAGAAALAVSATAGWTEPGSGQLALLGTATPKAAASGSSVLSLVGTQVINGFGSVSLSGSSAAAAGAVPSGALVFSGAAGWSTAGSGQLGFSGASTPSGNGAATGSLSLTATASWTVGMGASLLMLATQAGRLNAVLSVMTAAVAPSIAALGNAFLTLGQLLAVTLNDWGLISGSISDPRDSGTLSDPRYTGTILGIAMTSDRRIIYVGSTEYIDVPLTNANGVLFSTQPVLFSFDEGVTWNPGIWQGTAAATRVCSILLGTGGVPVPPEGIYRVRVKVVDNPEMPIIDVGKLQVKV